MGDDGQVFAEALRSAVDRRALVVESARAVLAGDVVDGLPVTSFTIGELMVRYRESIEAQFSGGDE